MRCGPGGHRVAFQGTAFREVSRRTHVPGRVLQQHEATWTKETADDRSSPRLAHASPDERGLADARRPHAGTRPAEDSPGRARSDRRRGTGRLRLAPARRYDLVPGDRVGADRAAVGRPVPAALSPHESALLPARGTCARTRRGRALHLRAGAVGRLGAGRAGARPQSLRPVRAPHAGLRSCRPGPGVAEPDLTAARQSLAGTPDRVRLSRVQRGLRDVRVGGRSDRRTRRGRLPGHPGGCLGHPVGHVLRPDRGDRLGAGAEPPA